MENWTEGEWLEWLDERRDADYLPSDEPDEEVYFHWKIAMWSAAYSLRSDFVHFYTDWSLDERWLKGRLLNIMKERASWQKDMIRETRSTSHRTAAILTIFDTLTQ